MPEKKLIIRVVASFSEKDELFSWLQKFATHHDNQFAYWDEFAFTTSDAVAADGILVLNTPLRKMGVQSFPEWVIAFMMEPGILFEHPWMWRKLEQYAKVYSPLKNSDNTLQSHGFLGWYFKHSWSSLTNLQIPEKTKMISCIASGLRRLKGHKKRADFIRLLRQELPEIDFFGKGTLYLDDKMEGLMPYKYSIAIENTSAPHYFTEKINDCFLAWTVPIYYGCTNIENYYPSGAVISIDIEKPEAAIGKIKDVLSNDNWSTRLEALKEARELVLNKYQPLAGAAGILRSIPRSGTKKEIVLLPVMQTFTDKLLRKIGL